MRKAILLLFYSLIAFATFGQCDCVKIEPFKSYVAAGLETPFKIATPNGFIPSSENISAFQYEYTRDSLTEKLNRTPKALDVEFFENGLSVSSAKVGPLEVVVHLDGEDCSTTFKVKPLPVKAVLGRNYPRSDRKMSIGEFKAQPGLLARIDNFDICAQCRVKEFELIRIPKDDLPQRCLNIGGRYEKEARAIIEETIGGDLYLFRNIRALCPGDTETRRLEDMTFEIAESLFDVDTISYPNGYIVRVQIDKDSKDTIRLDHFTGDYKIISKNGTLVSVGSYRAESS